MVAHNCERDTLTKIRQQVLNRAVSRYLENFRLEGVIDLGCGIGYSGESLKSGYKIGVDIDISKLEVAKGKYDDRIHASVTHLPFRQLPPGYAVVTMDVLSELNYESVERASKGVKGIAWLENLKKMMKENDCEEMALQEFKRIGPERIIVHDYNDRLVEKVEDNAEGQVRSLKIDETGSLFEYPCKSKRDLELKVSLQTVETVLQRKLDDAELQEMEKNPRGLNRDKGVMNFGRVILEVY